jgi:hypothetical protein
LNSRPVPAYPSVRLVRSPWTDTLGELVALAEKDLFVACPVLKRDAVRRIISQLDSRGLLASIRVSVLTDLRPESTLSGSMDLDALTELGLRISGFELTHLPSVHAKVYVADSAMAVVTSGNLTEAGLYGNIEYGVALTAGDLVRQIRSDFNGYAALGAKVSTEEVAALSSEMKELQVLFRRAESSIRQRARRAFQGKLQSTHLRLLRHRARGKTTHAIFSATIRFLLGKGPLRTEELHPMVQLLHPDLCDDSIDRVIEGVHFGKKWKHYVRNAQQHLKQRGQIEFDGTRWHLRSRS